MPKDSDRYDRVVGRPKPTHVADPAELGRRIRGLREERGLSLRQASFPGCSPSYLSRVESGRRVPSPAVLETLAARLGAEVSVLLVEPRPPGRVPQHAMTDVEMGLRLGNDDAHERALGLLGQAQRLGDRDAESRMLEALGLFALEAREDALAIELLECALATADVPGPRERPSLYRALGRAYAGAGDLDSAAAILQAGFDDAAREPVDPDLLALFGTFLANAHTDRGEIGEAQFVLARVIVHERELAPGNALRLEWALARTYAEEGRSAIAERYTRGILARLEASENAPLRGKAHLLLAGVLLDQGRADEAVPHLDASKELLAERGPVDRVQLSLELGRLAMLRREPGEAERQARRALDLTGATEPGQAGSAYALLAQVALSRGQLDDARFLCRQATDALRGRAAPHYLGEAYETLARVEEEAGDLNAALAALRARPHMRFG
jgi:transcriptional regulator with XRE-family HTH domain